MFSNLIMGLTYSDHKPLPCGVPGRLSATDISSQSMVVVLVGISRLKMGWIYDEQNKKGNELPSGYD